MAGYDGPSIYNKQLNQENGKPKKPAEHAPDSASPFERLADRAEKARQSEALERPLRNSSASASKKNSPLFNRSSTPFQVRQVPSPYYGLHPRPEKKENPVDYRALKTRLEKPDEEVLLFEGFTQSIHPAEEAEEEGDAPSPLPPTDSMSLKLKQKRTKKRTGLSRTLSGIIQDEQHSISGKDKNMSSLFSTHVLNPSEKRNEPVLNRKRQK